MESISLAPEERKSLIRRMKQETKPSRRLRMHIVLLAADGYSPTEIARALYCSRTTVYATVRRFHKEREAAFADRKRRGPPPKLTEEDHRRLETLVEEAQPWAYGWLRSRWSCLLLALQLFCDRGIAVSRETVRRTLHRLGFVWRRPRPVPPPPDPGQKRRRLQAILEVLGQLSRGEGFFFGDETKLELNPRVGFAWMRKGKQQPLPTPGTNRKVWISGALNWLTGRFHWVVGPRKNSELFLALLGELRRVYRCYRQIHLAIDNDSSHTSGQVKEYVEGSKGRFVLHPLPARSPRTNPMELIWWGLHEAITRNHQCAELLELLEYAEQYLEEREPFSLQLGKDYRELELKRSPPKEASVQLSCASI
jgi:transposase